MTKDQAYCAMYAFLETRLKLTQSDDIACLLSDMSIDSDQTALKPGELRTADPAVWFDWEDACALAVDGKVDAFVKLRRR